MSSMMLATDEIPRHHTLHNVLYLSEVDRSVPYPTKATETGGNVVFVPARSYVKDTRGCGEPHIFSVI
jgi:hypothetical protein